MLQKKLPESMPSIGGYQLLEKVGVGGMSSVYKALDPKTKEVVAVKVATRAVAQDRFASKRFELEFEVAQTLDHPNLAKVLHHGRDREIPYLVMEFVDGPSLLQRLKNEGQLDEAVALPMFLEIADALTYLHARQIIHRDIKPGNILINSKNQAKLVDLGLSKNLESLADLTRSRIGLGTLQFASPEQFDDARSVDPRSDVYSLAATMFQTLTGEPPYGLGGPFKVLERKLNNRFDAPIKINPRIRPSVDAAIRMGLHADRDRRPGSCREFVALWTGAAATPTAADLPGGVAGHSSKSPTASPHSDKRRAGIRYATDLESDCRPVAAHSQPRWPAAIKDISTTGVCLRVKRRFEIGNVLDIMLAIQADGSVTMQHARVCWVREADAHAWLLGCEFVTPLDQEDLDTFFNDRMNRTDKM